MHRWSDSPVVTFSRDGRELSLGRSGDDPVLHLNGSQGLGVAPVEVSKSERLGGDGSIVRGVRYGDREVFLPLFVEAASTGALHEWRRSLNRLLAPVPGDPAGSLVDITIDDPSTGTSRMVRGLYTGGLEGEFGSDYHGDWQTLGLTFECPDPWWLGPERLRTLQVAPGTKPFLSDYKYSRRNYARNPRFDSLAGQFGVSEIVGSSGATVTLSSAWSSAGGSSLKITPNGSNISSSGLLMPYNSDLAGAEFGGKTITVGADIRLDAAQSGALHDNARSIGVGFVDASGVASTPSGNWSEPAPNVPGVARVTKTLTIPEGVQGIYVFVRNGSATTPVWVDALTIEVGETDGSYFDGDSDGARWLGASGASESGIVSGEGTPFFPIVLAPSNVAGEWDIDVQGDGEVWPTWEVVGPGHDLLIERGDERIFIEGEFAAGSTVRIDTRNGRITPDRWDDASLDTALFSLRPGTNRLRITMVGASTETLVRLVWHERFLEGI